MANNFLYTEPATGISMGSFESGGIHFQGIVLTNSSGTALPTDTTYGLSVDLKRIDSAIQFASLITDPDDSTLQAAVLDDAAYGTEIGLGVRTIGTVQERNSNWLLEELQFLGRMAARIVFLLESHLGNGQSTAEISREAIE